MHNRLIKIHQPGSPLMEGTAVTLDDEAAAEIARLVAAVRGPDESSPGVAEYRTVTAAFLADTSEVRPQRSMHALACNNKCQGVWAA